MSSLNNREGQGWSGRRHEEGSYRLNVGGRGWEGLKSGTFKSTMETIYPRLSLVTARSPLGYLGSVRKVAGKGLEIQLIDAIVRWCRCEPDYFAGKRKAEAFSPNGLIFFPVGS